MTVAKSTPASANMCGVYSSRGPSIALMSVSAAVTALILPCAVSRGESGESCPSSFDVRRVMCANKLVVTSSSVSIKSRTDCASRRLGREADLRDSVPLGMRDWLSFMLSGILVAR